MGIPHNGWFKIGNPIKIDDLEVPPFQEPSVSVFLPAVCPETDPRRALHCMVNPPRAAYGGGPAREARRRDPRGSGTDSVLKL